jgi:CDP-glucose 4,6-dehydratase
MALYWNKVRWRDVSEAERGPYESGLLKLNCDKALHYLNWHAVMGFEDTVRMTAEWYGTYYQNSSNISDFTINQITDYTRIANQKGLSWAL